MTVQFEINIKFYLETFVSYLSEINIKFGA